MYTMDLLCYFLTDLMAKALNTQVLVLNVTFSFLMLMTVHSSTINALFTKVAMFKFAMQQLPHSTSTYSAAR